MTKKTYDKLVGKLIKQNRTGQIWFIYGIEKINNRYEFVMSKFGKDYIDKHYMSCGPIVIGLKDNIGWTLLEDK
jgi:hypothetical protein